MKQKVSLVLSGGGARGIAHIGVIEELERQNFEICSVTGTSMGAIVGGVFALGKLDEYKQWLFTIDKLKLFGLVDFTLSSQGLIKGDKVFKKMMGFISDANIEDLQINYAAVATDILNRREVIFTQGSIYKALRASVAIPTVITPVKADYGLLVDGGVLNNIPINHAKRIPNDILVAVDVNADIPVNKPDISKKEKNEKQSVYQNKVLDFYSHLRKVHPKNHEEHLSYFNLISKTVSLMTHRISQLLLEKYVPDILIEVSHNSCGMYDFYKAEELVEIGRHAAVEKLKEFKSKVN